MITQGKGDSKPCRPRGKGSSSAKALGQSMSDIVEGHQGNSFIMGE